MSTPIDKLKALANQGWSVDRISEMKNILKASEISPTIPFEGYINDLAPIRFLLHFSDFEEPMVRLLWHRYTEMKLKGSGVDQLLKKAIEFIQLFTDHNYEGISNLIEKQLHAFSPDLDVLSRVIRRNYRANLWNIVTQSFQEISRKELLGIFGVPKLGDLKEEGFSFTEHENYVQLEPIAKPRETQKECEIQMKILENAVSRIEKM